MSRILLLEDDTMIASGILYALESEGYETNHATRIKDARSLIEHYNFDLAIIDMQLPDGTGPEDLIFKVKKSFMDLIRFFHIFF